MKEPAKRLIFWAPRVLCLLFAAFISIFAANAFSEGHELWNTTLLVLLHLVPTGIVLVVLGVAWRWEWVGEFLFTALGVSYLIWAWGIFPWSVYVVISGPLFLVGVLFLINWFCRAELRTIT